MDTLKDFWASLVAGIRERTTNPLTVAFIVSWFLWNYKFFVVLLGDGPTAERLKTIEMMYPHVPETYWGGALFYPVLSAVVYVVVYPLIGMGAIWVYRQYQVATANLVKQVEKARTITPQERDALIQAHEKERKKLTAEAEALSIQLTAIRAALTTTEEQLEKASARDLTPEAPQVVASEETAPATLEKEKANNNSQSESPVKDDPTDPSMPEVDNIKILIHISEYSNGVSLEIIANNLKMNPTLVRKQLRDLSTTKYVNQNTVTGNWRLTEKGEDFVVKLLKQKR